MPYVGKYYFPQFTIIPHIRNDTNTYYIPSTSETFTDKEEYLKKISYYNANIWTCRSTGTSQLSYEEAIKSEERINTFIDQRFPIFYENVILEFLHLSLETLDKLVDLCHTKINNNFFLNQPVKIFTKKKGIISNILTSKDQITYNVQHKDQTYTYNITSDQIRSDITPPSKELIRLFIRSRGYRAHASQNFLWIVCQSGYKCPFKFTNDQLRKEAIHFIETKIAKLHKIKYNGNLAWIGLNPSELYNGDIDVHRNNKRDPLSPSHNLKINNSKGIFKPTTHFDKKITLNKMNGDVLNPINIDSDDDDHNIPPIKLDEHQEEISIIQCKNLTPITLNKAFYNQINFKNLGKITGLAADQLSKTKNAQNATHKVRFGGIVKIKSQKPKDKKIYGFFGSKHNAAIVKNEIRFGGLIKIKGHDSKVKNACIDLGSKHNAVMAQTKSIDLNGKKILKFVVPDKAKKSRSGNGDTEDDNENLYDLSKKLKANSEEGVTIKNKIIPHYNKQLKLNLSQDIVAYYIKKLKQIENRESKRYRSFILKVALALNKRQRQILPEPYKSEVERKALFLQEKTRLKAMPEDQRKEFFKKKEEERRKNKNEKLRLRKAQERIDKQELTKKYDETFLNLPDLVPTPLKLLDKYPSVTPAYDELILILTHFHNTFINDLLDPDSNNNNPNTNSAQNYMTYDDMVLGLFRTQDNYIFTQCDMSDPKRLVTKDKDGEENLDILVKYNAGPLHNFAIGLVQLILSDAISENLKEFEISLTEVNISIGTLGELIRRCLNLLPKEKDELFKNISSKTKTTQEDNLKESFNTTHTSTDSLLNSPSSQLTNTIDNITTKTFKAIASLSHKEFELMSGQERTLIISALCSKVIDSFALDQLIDLKHTRLSKLRKTQMDLMALQHTTVSSLPQPSSQLINNYKILSNDENNNKENSNITVKDGEPEIKDDGKGNDSKSIVEKLEIKDKNDNVSTDAQKIEMSNEFNCKLLAPHTSSQSSVPLINYSTENNLESNGIVPELELKDLASVVKNRRFKSEEEKAKIKEKEEALKIEQEKLWKAANLIASLEKIKIKIREAESQLKHCLRATPLGIDRHNRRYWFLKNQPYLYVESGWFKDEFNLDGQNSSGTLFSDNKQWFYYDNVSQIDQLIENLEIRGINEMDLKSNLEANYKEICKTFAKHFQIKSLDAKDIKVDMRNDVISTNEIGKENSNEKNANNNDHAERREMKLVTDDIDDTYGLTSNAYKFLVQEFKIELLDLENRLAKGGLGGVSNLELFEKQIEFTTDIKILGDALYQVYLTIYDKFLKGYLNPNIRPNQNTNSSHVTNTQYSSAEKVGEECIPKIIMNPNILTKNIGKSKLHQEVSLQWKQSLHNPRTLSRLWVMMELLNFSIKWEKSAEKTKCKICRRKEDSNRIIILCDGCDKAYHLNCLRPTLTKVPDGDWLCPACIPVSSRSDTLRKKIEKRNKYRESKNDILADEGGESENESGIVSENSDASSVAENGDIKDKNNSEKLILPSHQKNLHYNKDNLQYKVKPAKCKACKLTCPDVLIEGGYAEENNLMITCCQCSSNFHMSCHKPPLRYPPRTGWKCTRCHNGTIPQTIKRVKRAVQTNRKNRRRRLRC